jgi:hypothetical protein
LSVLEHLIVDLGHVRVKWDVAVFEEFAWYSVWSDCSPVAQLAGRFANLLGCYW